MIAIALYSVVCSQCSTCGLPQQEDSLPELIVQIHTVGYRMLVHSQDIKRLQLNRLLSTVLSPTPSILMRMDQRQLWASWRRKGN